MKIDTLTYYSSVKTSLIKKNLFKGTLLSTLGLFPMLFGPIYLREQWGLPIFFLGIGLIALGMIPFKRLKRLEENPHKLSLSNQNEILFSLHGKKTLTIPLSSIEHMQYIEQGSLYGVGIRIKKPPPCKLTVHSPSFNMARYQDLSRKRYNCDLFLPYFSKKAYDTIKDFGAPNRIYSI